MAYDPVKAHEYYERTKKLKGRQPGEGKKSPPIQRAPTAHVSGKSLSSAEHAAQARVTRLKAKVSTLESALSKANAELSKKRQAARETKRKNSDGKSTTQEKQASKEYRDKHKAEIASKRKSKSSSSGGSSSSSSSNSISDMSASELTSRIIKIRGVLAEARRQLSNAQQQLGQLAHSAITSEPEFNEHFARFRSAERIPSK
jgi:chromosome segregation ATPase